MVNKYKLQCSEFILENKDLTRELNVSFAPLFHGLTRLVYLYRAVNLGILRNCFKVSWEERSLKGNKSYWKGILRQICLTLNDVGWNWISFYMRHSRLMRPKTLHHWISIFSSRSVLIFISHGNRAPFGKSHRCPPHRPDKQKKNTKASKLNKSPWQRQINR